MKKNKIIVFSFILLLIISVVSIGLNIKNASAQDRIRRNMINHVYSELTNISINLDGLIYNIENEVTDDETNRQSLTMLSHNFVKVDTILKQFGSWFPDTGFGVNVYAGGVFDFGYISYTLTAGTGTANDVPYSGITADNTISENEVRYLTVLRDDIDLIIAAMVSAENPPQENQNLTVSQLNNILNDFFSKWSYLHEDSPYFLLRRELRSMTLDDIRAMAKNIGTDLTMGDLHEYAVDDMGEGLYGYRVAGGIDPYNLLVASDDMQTVIYTKFYNPLYGGLTGNTSEAIDIRYYDVDKFIADGTQELLRQLPESP